jgi:hypothetical protein
MVDYPALRKDSADLLGTEVTAAGLFVIDIGWVKPAAGGLAGALAGDVAATAIGLDGGLAEGLTEGAAHVAGKHAVYQGAADAAGITPVMVLAVTSDEFVLMDWLGNVRSGTGPTTVFARFPRATSSVTSTQSGPTRRIVLTEGDVEARIQCTLGLFAPGKAEMRQVLVALGTE